MKIAIIGSSAFTKEMVNYRDRLRELGHVCNVHEHYVAQARGEGQDLIERIHREHAALKKEFDYIRYHYNEIVDSDAVLVLNFDKNRIAHYIGGNTLMELGFAHVHRKKIFMINPIPEMQYTDEIKAVDPIVINNDLSKIV